MFKSSPNVPSRPGWSSFVPVNQARLVWLYADDIPRKMVCARVGMSLSKAWRVWSAAIMIIISMLNKNIKVVQSKENKEDMFLQEYQRNGNASAAYKLAFQCNGLTGDAIQARARRLVRRCQTDAQPSLEPSLDNQSGGSNRR